jgi:L-lactate dehydrogenase complex protein LldG
MVVEARKDWRRAMSDTARSAILGSIRSAYASHERKPAPEDYAAIQRHYLRESQLSTEDLLALFTDRLHEYDAGVVHVTETTLRATVEKILRQRERYRMAIPAGLPAEWLPESVIFLIADRLSAQDLDQIGGVMTACTVAIARTGSLVLQNVPGQGPRALSLVPDYHLCVVFTEQIVETVPEAFERLKATAPTTFISGPSATADIEMTRIKGVHGPRFLDVVIVTGER